MQYKICNVVFTAHFECTWNWENQNNDKFSETMAVNFVFIHENMFQFYFKKEGKHVSI